MNSNLQSPVPTLRAMSGERWAAIAGALGSALLLARKLLSHRPARRDWVTRAEFCSEMLASRERMHADHLSLLEKLDANHRELLAALERQGTRLNAVEMGLARLDERTAPRSPKSKD